MKPSPGYMIQMKRISKCSYFNTKILSKVQLPYREEVKSRKEDKMKFVDKQPSDDSLDIVCCMCPMHLLKPGERLRRMKKGQILEILTDYDGALDDIPEWCKKCGYEFLGMDEGEDFYKLYIKKIK